MKKIFAIALLLPLWTLGGFAQGLDEDFENFDFTGWTCVYPEGYQTQPETGTTFGWQTENYSSKTYASHIGLNNEGGKTALKSFTGRYGTQGINAVSDNWLISPEVKVDAKHCYLTFQFGANDAINAHEATLSDVNRMKLQVLVSTEGTDTATFKDAKTQIIPIGVQKWCAYCIDLSEYVGKTIHIAFRDYGTPVTAVGSQRDSKYIDNIHMYGTAKSDYAVTESSVIFGGAIYEQPYSIKVANYGASKGGFTACYKLGDKLVKENVESDIACGDTLRYTFKENLKLTPGESLNFRAWVSVKGDAFVANDSTAIEAVTSAERQDLPYSTESLDLQAEFTGVTSNSINCTMVYDASKAQGWLFTQKKSGKPGYAYLYTNKAMNLPKGDVSLDITGTCIGTDISYEVYIAKYGDKKMAEYGTLVGTSETVQASQTDVVTSVSLVIPEAGYYIIGLRPIANAQYDQTAIHGIGLKSMTGGDVALASIDAPMNAETAGEKTVSVSIKNNASLDANNFTVAYQIDDNAPVKEKVSTVEGSKTLSYTFQQKAALTDAKKLYRLKAWVEKKGDTRQENDSASMDVYAYEEKSFPYTTSFEDEADSLEWMDVNAGQSDSYWADSKNIYAIDGLHVMYINKNNAAMHDNYAVSPLIKLAKNQTGRISFYFIGTANAAGNIDVYLSKSASVEALKEATFVGSGAVGPTYTYFSQPVTVEEAGDYYVAVRHHDSSCDVWFDDFRFDDTAEIAVTGAETDVKGTTVSADETALTVLLRNAGTKDLTGVQVAYKINSEKDFVTETIDETIKANTYYEYTFKKKITLDKAGQDTISVAVTHKDDSDMKNNKVVILGPTKLFPMTVPFTLGFEDNTQNELCNFASSNWSIAAKTPSDGSQALLHQNAASADGDWAYLPAMQLNKGKYDISFFWKTYSSLSHSSKQSFVVYLGKETKPEAMNTTVFEFSGVVNADSKAKKEMTTVEILEDGVYFLGIKCTTDEDYELRDQSLNQLVLDEFEVNANPVEGITIDKDETLEKSLRDTEFWHRYYTNSVAANQWRDVADADEGIYTSRNLSTATNTWTTPGLINSQPVAVKTGEVYTVSMDYAIEKIGATELDGNSTVAVYAASRNLPQDYTTLVVQGKEDATNAAATFTVEEDGVVYFGIVCDSKVTAKFTLNSVTITNGDIDGIREFRSSGVPEFQSSKWFNVAGQRVDADAKGIVIVNGKKVVR